MTDNHLLNPGQKAVLQAQQLRDREARLAAKRIKKLKRWQEERLRERDWPLDAASGRRADVDPEDVNAPLPFEIKEITAEQLAAANASASSLASQYVEIDENVLARRSLDREREIAARAAVVGEKWTEELVEARVEEAFKVLGRIAVGATSPREFGNGMPTPLRSMADLVNQAGNKSLRNAMKRMLRDDGPPSGEEVTRMNDSLYWAVKYLRNEDSDLAMFLNLGGLWKAGGRKVTKECAKLGVPRQEFYRDRKAAVKKIVEGLIRDGRAPT
jgi:hypothetical protein